MLLAIRLRHFEPLGNLCAFLCIGYSISRVQRSCDAETVAAVMSGEMSPNAALVKAGIRKKKSPEEIVMDKFKRCDDKVHVMRLQLEMLNDAERVEFVATTCR